MKAISLHQPWATLVALGEKQYETRSWKPSYRGLLAIHAAKQFNEIQQGLCLQSPFSGSLREAGYRVPHSLPLGGILCVVRLVDVVPTGQVPDKLSAKELAFGNYGPGRFANPIPMAGMQSLFDVADDLLMRFQ